MFSTAIWDHLHSIFPNYVSSQFIITIAYHHQYNSCNYHSHPHYHHHYRSSFFSWRYHCNTRPNWSSWIPMNSCCDINDSFPDGCEVMTVKENRWSAGMTSSVSGLKYERNLFVLSSLISLFFYLFIFYSQYFLFVELFLYFLLFSSSFYSGYFLFVEVFI